jgi:hypothetical protein
MHRFQLPRLGGEFASDSDESDRLFSDNSLYFVGLVLDPGFFSQPLAQNFSQQFASFVFGCTGSKCDRRGSFFSAWEFFMLTTALEWLVEEFLNFKQTNVDDGSQISETYNSPEEMEQVFEEWVDELVHNFVSGLDWKEIFKERQERNDA